MSNEYEKHDTYLGDGVYASFDGYHIILDLRAQDNSKIALDPSVFAKLLEYKKYLYEYYANENIKNK